MFALNLIKYIKIPLFIVGTVYDRWQIDNQVIYNDVDKIAQHSTVLQQAILSWYNPDGAFRNALWLFRCYCHTGCLIHRINDRNLHMYLVIGTMVLKINMNINISVNMKMIYKGMECEF